MKNNFLKLTLLFVGFVFSNSHFAQEIDITIGDEAKLNKRESIIKVHHAEDGLIVLKRTFKLIGGGDNFLEIFDDKMNFVKRNEIVFDDRDLELYQMEYLDGKIYVFLKKYDKMKENNTIYGATMNRDGKIDSDLIELIQYDIEKRKRINTFYISLSADSSNFLLRSTPPTIDKEQMASYEFLIFDLDFDVVDDIKLDLPYKDSDFAINSTHLDEKGNIHMLTSIAIEETRRNTIFRTSVETEARVFTLYKGESEVEEYKIDFLNDDVGFISQIKIKTDDLGRLQCAGFYSDTKGNSTRGVFVFTIDPITKEISNVSSQEFTDEYLNQFLTEKQLNKKERKKSKNKENPYDRLYNYKVRDIVMKKGGGFYMIAEYYQLRVSTTTDANGNTRTTYHYYYNDLMVINVLKDNTVDWYSRVAKRQYSTNDGGLFSGIVTGLNEDNSLNIIFNDNEATSTIVEHPNERIVSIKNATVVLVKFEEDGTATKTPLFGSKSLKTYVVPYASPQGKQNDIILYSRGKKNNRFTNVILK